MAVRPGNEDGVNIALDRSFYRDVKGYACAECATMTQIRNLREKNQDFVFGEFKNELREKLKVLGLHYAIGYLSAVLTVCLSFFGVFSCNL